jgi:hypothetical protein
VSEVILHEALCCCRTHFRSVCSIRFRRLRVAEGNRYRFLLVERESVAFSAGIGVQAASNTPKELLRALNFVRLA